MELVDQYKSQDIKSVGEVLMCQHHPTVYTLGLREKNDIELTDRLKRVGADVVKTRRGGLTTCHSVGQLICYPILNLRKLKIGPRQYIHSLERAVITTCNILDVIAHTTDNVGVWIGNDKVCAIGKPPAIHQ
jgi:lipoyl(octanoyl) transferase